MVHPEGVKRLISSGPALIAKVMKGGVTEAMEHNKILARPRENKTAAL